MPTGGEGCFRRAWLLVLPCGAIGLSDAGLMAPKSGCLASCEHIERFKYISIILLSLLIGHFRGRRECGCGLTRGEIELLYLLAEQCPNVFKTEIESSRIRKAIEIFPDRLYRKRAHRSVLGTVDLMKRFIHLPLFRIRKVEPYAYPVRILHTPRSAFSCSPARYS